MSQNYHPAGLSGKIDPARPIGGAVAALAVGCALSLSACLESRGPVVSLVAGGDCLPDRSGASRPYDAALDRRWDGIAAACRGDAAAASRGQSERKIFLFNLESTVGSGGAPRDKPYVFRCSPAALGPIAALPTPTAALANNHAMDYGPEGLLSTIAALDTAGIAHAGAGTTTEEAWSAAIVETSAGRVSILNCGYDNEESSYSDAHGAAIAPVAPAQLRERVRELRANSFVVVAMLHWGAEYQTSHRRSERELARSIVDAGADLVVGSGPHVLRGIEKYRGSLICYSLGNLLFDDLGDEETATACLVRMRCFKDRNGALRKEFGIAPMKTAHAHEGPRSPDAPTARGIVARIALRSPDPSLLGTSEPALEGGVLWFPIPGD